MEFLIDNSCFIYQCLNIFDSSDNYSNSIRFEFTYKTSSKNINVANLMEKYFAVLRSINSCTNEKLSEEFSKRKHHFKLIDNQKCLNLISKIYEKSNLSLVFKRKGAQLPVYEIKIYEGIQDPDPKSYIRLFMGISDSDEAKKITIVRPFFLDLNHLIFPLPENKVIKEFDKCFVCHEEECIVDKNSFS